MTKLLKTSLLAAAAALAVAAPSTKAEASVRVRVGFCRPVVVRPVRRVVINPPGPGYVVVSRPSVWVRGHYDRFGRWIPGHYR